MRWYIFDHFYKTWMLKGIISTSYLSSSNQHFGILIKSTTKKNRLAPRATRSAYLIYKLELEGSIQLWWN